MKNTYLSLIVILFCQFQAASQDLISSAHTRQQDDLADPQTNLRVEPSLGSQEYLLFAKRTDSWNSGSWQSSDSLEYDYNSENHFARYIWRKYDGFDWYLYYRLNHTFDINNNVILKLWSEWSSGKWVNRDRELQEFDTQGNRTLNHHQYLVDSAWVDNYRLMYTYDNQGNLTQCIGQYWINQQWTNWSRQTYQYDINGNIIYYLHEEADSMDYARKSNLRGDRLGVTKSKHQRTNLFTTLWCCTL